MDFLDNIYLYSFEGIRDSVYEYRFISEGNENITKVVTLRPIKNQEGFYNLGFGNLEVNSGKTIINDESTENNSDYDKVLETVFACMLHFFKQEQKAKVVFFGNTEHKHFIYKMKVSAKLEKLKEELVIMGGYADYEIKINETKQIIDVESGNKKTRKIRSKDLNTLIYKGLKGIEIFEVNNSRYYDFVLFSLKTG